MKVREFMNEEVVTVDVNQKLSEVSRLFHERGISGAPVIDQDGELVGMISDSDILKAVEPHRETLRLRYPSLSFMSVTFDRDVEERSLTEVCREIQETPVREHMSSEIIHLTPDDGMERAITLMNQNDVNRLPVLDGKEIVGIITRADIIRCLDASGPSELEKNG
jgi:CBS domain-containing protein